jgi:hypothetical protein
LSVASLDSMPRVPAPDVRRWAGVAAITVAAFLITEAIAKLTVGARPALDQSDALVAYVERSSAAIIVVILADTFLMAALIVFLGAFRQLVVAARPHLSWIADVMFGGGLVFVAVTLVGDSLDGGTALDVWNLRADPSSIRALIEGHTLMFGSIGSVLLALVSAAAAYLTFASAVVPRWTGIFATITAASNLVWAPVAFGGTEPGSFLAAGGWGNAVLAIFPWLAWVLCVGISAVRGARPGTHPSGSPIRGHKLTPDPVP